MKERTGKVVIFGGTGFIGLSLAEHLAKQGFSPVLIARHQPRRPLPYPFCTWDAQSVGDWVTELEGATAIVNLAGKSVDCIKTPENCDLILRSRVDATKAIGYALEQVKRLPKVWVQMSTAHIYGDPPTQLCTESSTTGYGLAPFVAQKWEEAFLAALPIEMRGVRLRTGFVLGKNGGALQRLRHIVRLGLGGTVGHGRQGMSWIHEYDMNEIITQVIIDETYNGIYIASAPNPVSNRVFMMKMRKALRVFIGLPAPTWITKLGARFLFNTDPELALYGRYVKSERLEQRGFPYRFPYLQEALMDLLGR